ncbi:hypothetical protein [Maribellus maritimus]|uniref:hypothetical protein n=1 Tax=Maribellus maritimus TaxID=2870838 RepID=UPI001EEAEA5C|nr:hypothetical protein [Maribellus maritimus]MCG6191179.1 hypothetical protein [Maribellus maritimus]
MKKKIAFTTLLLLVTLSMNLFAQSKLTEQQKEEAKARYEAYKEKLNLTAEQEPKVQEINTKYFEALAELKNSNKSRLDKLKTFRNLKTDKNKKMKQVLTKEQYKIYIDFQEEIKEDFLKNRRN